MYVILNKTLVQRCVSNGTEVPRFLQTKTTIGVCYGSNKNQPVK